MPGLRAGFPLSAHRHPFLVDVMTGSGRRNMSDHAAAACDGVGRNVDNDDT